MTVVNCLLMLEYHIQRPDVYSTQMKTAITLDQVAHTLWNGEDPILKERIFGLTSNEGNQFNVLATA